MGTASDSSVLGENLGQCICSTFRGRKKEREEGWGVIEKVMTFRNNSGLSDSEHLPQFCKKQPRPPTILSSFVHRLRNVCARIGSFWEQVAAGSVAMSGVILGIHSQTAPLTSLAAEKQHQDHPLLLLDWVSFLPHWLQHPLCPLPGAVQTQL